MSNYLGTLLRDNMRMGLPTQTKSAGEYIGLPMMACGDFAKSGSRLPSMQSPWLSPAADKSSTVSYSLHDEITQFMNYMEPTTREKALRQDLVQRFSNLIASFGMDATVRPVGSYVTGLYLPTSDIDMVLTFRGHAYSSYAKSDLRLILYKIQSSGFASKVEDVLHATVPLIRITDKVTGIEIDLTAADTHGIKATEAVQKWMKNDSDTEIIKMLVTVVKMFLSIRKCGTTYTGGVNSYVLVWMVVAWVNLEWKKPKNTTHASTDISSLTSALDTLSIRTQVAVATTAENAYTSTSMTPTAAKKNTPATDFGRALRKFLDFYGNKFDYHGRAIKIEPRPSYLTKTYPYSRYPTTQRYLLSIFDPANGTIDMGAKAYGINHVQASFRQAHRLLVERQITSGTATRQGIHSILGEILGGDFTKFETKRKRLQ